MVSEEEGRERQREDLGFGVEALEGMLKIAEDALKAKTLQEEELKEMSNQEVRAKEKEKKPKG